MRRVLLAIIFCLFVSSMANAQCAWVLWERVSHHPIDKEGKWELKKAFPSYNECLEVKESEVHDTAEFMKIWNEVKKKNKSWVKINHGVNVVVWDGEMSEFTIFEYHCFPDTIDPRK
jgi:hypothetical protein